MDFGGFWILFLVLTVVIVLVVTSMRKDSSSQVQGPRACPGCGTMHPVHASFCRRCGKKLA